MKDVYYKPSGRFSLSFLLYFILFQVLAIPLLSVIYIYLVYYIPVAYFNFLITLGCGAAAGFVMAAVIKLGKVRNNIIAILFSIFAVCIMKYVQWCVYIPIVLSDAYEIYELTLADRFIMSFELLLYPSVVFDLAAFINQEGVWSMFSISFNGILLIIVWLLEFLIMAALACVLSLEQSKTPFSEEDGEWYVEMPNKTGASLPENFDDIKRDMERGDFKELIQLTQNYQPDNSQYLSLIFYKPKLSEQYYMNIKKVIVTNEKGKEKTSIESLIEYILIDNESARELQAVN